MTDHTYAPDFHLQAIRSGRSINRESCRGTPLVLLFHNQEAVDTVTALQRELRERWPDARNLLVASIVDMSGVPGIIHGMAKRVMGSAYAEAAQLLPEGLAPADYVIILPDWRGSVYRDFEIHDAGRAPTSVVVDGEWRLRGRSGGAQIVAETVRIVNGIASSGAS
jgi:hypothetical protein